MVSLAPSVKCFPFLTFMGRKVVIFGLIRSRHLKIMAEQRRLPASMSAGSRPAFSNVAFSFQYTPGKYFLVSLDSSFPHE